MVRAKTAVRHTGGRQALPAIILAALLAVPAYWFLRCDLFPFTDLPNHLAAATIYSHLDDPTTRFAEYFESQISWLKPNVAHILFCSAFPSAEIGNKVWMVSTLLLLGVSMVLVFRLTGANAAILPMAVLLVFNANLAWGFMGFALAVPLLLCLTVGLVLFSRRLSVWAGLVVALLLVMLFYAHVFALLFGLMFLVLALLLEVRLPARRRLVVGSAALLPAGLLVLGWILTGPEFRENPTREYLFTYYRWHFAGSLLPRAGRLLTNDNVALAASSGMIPWTGCFSLVMVSGLLLLVKKEARVRFMEKEGASIVLALLITSVLCYGLLPNAIPGVVPVYQRFSVMVLCSAFLAAALAFPPGRFTAGLTAAVLLSGVYLTAWSVYLHDFELYTQDFTPSFLAMAGGRSTVGAAVIRNPEFRSTRPLVHFNNYHTIWNLGVTPTKMAEYRFGAIRAKHGGKALPEYQEWVSPEANLQELLGRYAGMDFLLYHGAQQDFSSSDTSNLREVGASGSWIIYQRRGEK